MRSMNVVDMFSYGEFLKQKKAHRSNDQRALGRTRKLRQRSLKDYFREDCRSYTFGIAITNREEMATGRLITIWLPVFAG
jgi:hypothetical protein